MKRGSATVGCVSVSETLRLFVAIDPPEPVRVALAAQARPIRGITWTPAHQYHLTLRFVGDVAAAQREGIEGALAAVRVEAFILPVEGVGRFPPKGQPHVIWAGIGHGHPRLFQLRQQVDDALLGSGLTALDVRIFHPHITLGRCGPSVSANGVAQFLHDLRDFEAPLFFAEAFTLYQSELGPGGARHTPLLRLPLLSAAPSA